MNAIRGEMKEVQREYREVPRVRDVLTESKQRVVDAVNHRRRSGCPMTAQILEGEVQLQGFGGVLEWAARKDS